MTSVCIPIPNVVVCYLGTLLYSCASCFSKSKNDKPRRMFRQGTNT